MTHRPTASADPDLIHTSTRTHLTTNHDPAGVKPAQVVLRMTRVEMRWLDGEVAVRFTGRDIDVTPRSARRQSRREPR